MFNILQSVIQENIDQQQQFISEISYEILSTDDINVTLSQNDLQLLKYIIYYNDKYVSIVTDDSYWIVIEPVNQFQVCLIESQFQQKCKTINIVYDIEKPEILSINPPTVEQQLQQTQENEIMQVDYSIKCTENVIPVYTYTKPESQFNLIIGNNAYAYNSQLLNFYCINQSHVSDKLETTRDDTLDTIQNEYPLLQGSKSDESYQVFDNQLKLWQCCLLLGIALTLFITTSILNCKTIRKYRKQQKYFEVSIEDMVQII